MKKVIEQNTVLYTKDGRLIGNSIIGYPVDENRFFVHTDYGNTVVMNVEEIKEFFYFDFDNENIISEDHLNYNRESHKNYNKDNK